MKKKNAFTLVEILAVIVILAILALIAIPRVMDSVKTSKEAMYREQVTRIIESAQKLIQNDEEYLPAEVEWNFDVDEEDYNYTAVKDLLDIKKISLFEMKKLGYLKNSDTKNPLKPSKNMDEYVAVFYNHPYNQYEVVYCISEDYYKYYYSKDEYEKKVSVICDDSIKQPDNPEEETCILSNPIISVTPSGWAISKNIQIKYPEGGEYFVRLLNNETVVSGTAIKCEDFYDCSGTTYNAGDTITASDNELFKVSNNIIFRTENDNSADSVYADDTVTAIARKDDSCLSSKAMSVRNIDRTAPTVDFEIQRTGTKVELKFVEAKDDESDIFSKQYSMDGGTTWENVTSATKTVSQLIPGQTYNILFKAINKTYDGSTAGKTELIENVNYAVAQGSVTIDPVSVILKNTSSTNDTISFEARTGNAEYFKVEYKESGTSSYQLYKDLKTSKDNCKKESNKITCTIDGLVSNKTYDVRVTAASRHYTEGTTNTSLSATVDSSISTSTSVPTPKFVSESPTDEWTKNNKNITISYPKGNVSNPEYYFYVNTYNNSNNVISVNRVAYFCGSRTDVSCTTEVAKNTALQTGWYKLKTKDYNINLTITYTREYEYTFYAETHDGNTKSARWGGTFNGIDKTAPKISNLNVANTTSNSIKLTYTLTDKLTDRNVDGSGIDSASNGGVNCTCRANGSIVTATNKHGSYCVVEGLNSGTTYSCTVSSKDKVGNTSSNSINASTVSVHKVVFYNDGKKYAEQNVEHGKKVNALSSVPSKEGYTFKHWVIRGTNTIFSFNQAITSDLTLDAVYTPNKIRVQYHVNVEEDKLKYINFNTGDSNKFSLDGQYLLNNGSSYVQVFNYDDILSLNNNNTLLNWNGNYINITRTFWSVVPGEEWFKTKNGPKKTYNGITFTTTESAISYNQDGTINAKDLCDAKNGDCVVTLYLNWKYKNSEPSHDEPLVSGGNLITHGCGGSNPCCGGGCNMVHDGGSSGAYYTTPGHGFYRQNSDGSWSSNLAN